MENLGERLVGDYLRHIKGCDFVDFNVYTTKTQGEIDVIGVNLAKKQAFICEVVTHLSTGMQYVKNARPDTARRLTNKFIKDIQYGRDAFRGFNVSYMLWTPVVRRSRGKQEYDQFGHLDRVRAEIKRHRKVDLKLVINQDYIDAVDALRKVARSETKELKSPVMRFLQIEEWSRRNVARIAKAEANALSKRVRAER